MPAALQLRSPCRERRRQRPPGRHRARPLSAGVGRRRGRPASPPNRSAGCRLNLLSQQQRAARGDATPQRPWPTSISTKTSMAFGLVDAGLLSRPVASRSMPSALSTAMANRVVAVWTASASRASLDRVDHFVGDVDVGHAALGQRQRFVDLLHADAHRALRHLQQGQFGALVGFGVGPQPQPWAGRTRPCAAGCAPWRRDRSPARACRCWSTGLPDPALHAGEALLAGDWPVFRRCVHPE